MLGHLYAGNVQANAAVCAIGQAMGTLKANKPVVAQPVNNPISPAWHTASACKVGPYLPPSLPNCSILSYPLLSVTLELRWTLELNFPLTFTPLPRCILPVAPAPQCCSLIYSRRHHYIHPHFHHITAVHYILAFQLGDWDARTGSSILSHASPRTLSNLVMSPAISSTGSLPTDDLVLDHHFGVVVLAGPHTCYKLRWLPSNR